MMTQTDYWRLFEETGDIGYYLVYKYYAGNVAKGATAVASASAPSATSVKTSAMNAARKKA
jgi:hypothetical protein